MLTDDRVRIAELRLMLPMAKLQLMFTKPTPFSPESARPPSTLNAMSSRSGFNLLLIRHGQSTNNAGEPERRVPDTPLTNLGWDQAGQLGPLLAETERIDHLLTSPFLRTLQTTQPIAEACGLQPTIRTGLHETGGCYAGYHPDEQVGMPGMTATEIARDFPGYAIPDDIDEAGWWKSQVPETGEQAAVRAARQFDVLRSEFADSGQVVATVAHGDFIMLVLTAALDHWPGHGEAPIANTSVTRLLVTDSAVELVVDRSTDHLQPVQISY